VPLKQEQSGGDNSVLVQAGRDVVLPIVKSPPDVRLVRLTIDEDEAQQGLRQKLNIIVKNNGDTTAFIQKGSLVVTGKVTIVNCNEIGMRYQLSQADWQYDVDIDDPAPSLIGQHSIAPTEVVNFDVMVGRRSGGHELTVYRAFLRLQFDEGPPVETGSFHLDISGPTIWLAGTIFEGPTPEEWGRCMADNIRRLDEIGYDYRPRIDPDSAQYIEAVAPGLLRRNE
jgi:hypothetical protein